MTKPDEHWLAVVHKRTWDLDCEASIRKWLPTAVSDNVDVLTWGAHMATNAFRDVANVILCGTLFYPTSHYTALTHLAQSRNVQPGLAPDVDIQDIMRGEHANLILQAVSRGAVRKCNGAQSHPMDAYIIAAVRSGIRQSLPSIFPGCSVRPWEPFERTLVGKPLAAFQVVQRAVEAGAAEITVAEVAKAIGVDRSNFAKRILTLPEWLEAVAGLDLFVATGKRGAKVLRRDTAEPLLAAA